MAAKLLVQPPLKWHGGKVDLANWIVGLMPPRCETPNAPGDGDAGWLHYVEPYFGGGAVLFANDPEGISEVIGDKNTELTNFWRVLAHPLQFDRMKRVMEATPFSKCEYEQAEKSAAVLSELMDSRIPGSVDCVGRACRFFISCRQSLSGRMDSFASITRNRTRRGMNEQVSAWLNCIEGLPAVHARLKRVLILNDDALTVIRKEDGPRTLFYLDPPYLHETRATTGEYQHEMSYEQHRELLEILKSIKGRFLLSGYDSDLYRGYSQTTPRWNKHEMKINNHAAGGKTKRVMTECVWCNF